MPVSLFDSSSRPIVMGILNVTPDSFSDGGRYVDPDTALARATEMIREGAEILDIGGASSRPRGQAYGEGAQVIPASQELSRILPVIERIARHHPDILISVDTFRTDVAEKALAAGAGMLNDITALRFDARMAQVAADFHVPLCLMHSVGLPGDMPHTLDTPDVVEIVVRELAQARQQARAAGVEHVLLDPGFGFGKSHDGNLALIARLSELTALGSPVLVGVSRKSSIGAALSHSDRHVPPPDERLMGSLAVTAVAVLNGAKVIRTHDVKETTDFLRVLYRTRIQSPRADHLS